MNKIERIGIVLVHGMGEQRRFQHLSSEVQHLLSALEADDSIRVSVDTRFTMDSVFLAEQPTWLAEAGAPVRIDISAIGSKRTRPHKSIYIHEVWWADLDNKVTLWNRIRFWCWGLGMWTAKRFRDPVLPGTKHSMRPPNAATGAWANIATRTRLLLFGVFFLLTAITFNLFNALLKIFKLGQLPIPSEVFYQYVGDVKLYQDRSRKGKGHPGSLADRGLAPRIAIRRRMVHALVAAHRQEYDRWYVLAHSMGSVVAFNGLMETAHALPNYLSRAFYRSLPDELLYNDERLDSSHTRKMFPRRPLWITDDREALDREKLFKGLRGFVTYGSPLDKYAYLWPQIVPINKDNSVFQKAFEWINIFDHSDPVGGRLNAFTSAFGDGQEPTNLAYKACWALLYSHTKYLRSGCGNVETTAVSVLMKWILDGQSRFPVPKKRGWGTRWYKRQDLVFGLLVRSWMWILATAIELLFLWCIWWCICKFVLGQAFKLWHICACGFGRRWFMVLLGLPVLLAGILCRPYECLLDFRNTRRAIRDQE